MGSNNNRTLEESFALQFINSLRVHINYPEISENYVKHIENLFEEVLSSVVTSIELEPISLIICQSCTKYSQVLPIKTNRDRLRYYLAFDKQLSNINQLMADLYFSDDDPGHDIWKLAYELFTEEAISEGEELLATYFGLNKIALGEFSVKNEESKYDSAFVSSIQDLYILGHEVGHFLYDLYTGDKTNDNFNVSTDFGRLANEVKAILEEVYASYKNQFREREYKALITEQEGGIQSQNRIIEECVADALSYAVIFAIVAEEYPNDTGKKMQAIQAVFLELMNLELLAMHHMTVSDDSFENSTSIRLAFFRNYAATYFDDAPAGFSKMLQETVLRYEERITNLMLECFSELERRSDCLFDVVTRPDGTFDFQQIIGLG